MPSNTLSEAIEGLYKAFSNIEKPLTIDGCPCCIDRKGIGTLLAKPLRQLTPRDLSPYAFSAFLTVGDVADYLYFLPRILEITATEPSWCPDPAITASAIRSSKFESWTSAQRQALDNYLEAVVASILETGEYMAIGSWICAIGCIGLDVRPYLEIVAQCPEAVLVYFELNADSLPRNKLAGAFWELPSAAHDAVVDWFFSPEIAKIPFDAYGCVLTRMESTRMPDTVD